VEIRKGAPARATDELNTMGLSRGTSCLQLNLNPKKTNRCHGLAPWNFTF
jgi:hypothetical protein